jgi:hypothetical protein
LRDSYAAKTFARRSRIKPIIGDRTGNGQASMAGASEQFKTRGRDIGELALGLSRVRGALLRGATMKFHKIPENTISAAELTSKEFSVNADAMSTADDAWVRILVICEKLMDSEINQHHRSGFVRELTIEWLDFQKNIEKLFIMPKCKCADNDEA